MEQDQKDNPAQEAQAEAVQLAEETVRLVAGENAEGEDAAQRGTEWLNACLPGQEGEKPVGDTSATDARMFLHILPVAKQLDGFMKELSAEDIKSGAIVERTARSVAVANPAELFNNADQIADLPCAGELFTSAAKAVPGIALGAIGKLEGRPYRGAVMEIAARMAACSDKMGIREAIFTFAHLFANEPWAREVMLAALDVFAGLTVSRAAVTYVKHYEDQPYVEEVLDASFKIDEWLAFEVAKSYSHLPCAKNLLCAVAARFPWGAFRRIGDYIELPYAGDVLLAAINGGFMKEKDWHPDFDGSGTSLAKTAVGESVYSAMAVKFPDLILKEHFIIRYRPWGREVIRSAMRSASVRTPMAALQVHPVQNEGSGFNTNVLGRDLMSDEEWESVLETSAWSLCEQQPQKVFDKLTLLGNRPFAREIALAACPRAPSEAMRYIDLCAKGFQKKPSYFDELLELAVRSVIGIESHAPISFIPVFVGYPWAEEIMLRLAGTNPVEVSVALPHFANQPWSNRVMSKIVSVRSNGAVASAPESELQSV